MHLECAGHNDDRHEREQFFQLGQKLQSEFAFIKHMIQDNNVGRIFGDHCQGLAGRANSLQAVFGQSVFVNLVLEVVVLHDENLRRVHVWVRPQSKPVTQRDSSAQIIIPSLASSCRATDIRGQLCTLTAIGAAGIMMVNVLPLPSAVSTLKPQPISFANSYTMDRPNPVPRWVENAFVVKNGSKMRGRICGAMPQPSSCTAMKTYSSAWAGARTRSPGRLFKPPIRRMTLP